MDKDRTLSLDTWICSFQLIIFNIARFNFVLSKQQGRGQIEESLRVGHSTRRGGYICCLLPALCLDFTLHNCRGFFVH